MKTLQTEITIQSDATTVWNILMDHPAYSQWNPFIRSISGSTKVGEHLEVRITQKNKKEMKFSPIVLRNDEEKEFRWKGKLFVKGLFDGEHFFRLERTENGDTKFIHGEIFTGIMVAPLLKMIGDETREGFIKMNEALKELAESTNK